MKNIHCLALIHKDSKQLIEQLAVFPALSLEGVYNDPLQLQEALSSYQNSVLFLDADFPGHEGMQFLKRLTFQPLTVILSHYTEYAFEAFSYNVIDYLRKPIQSEQLARTVSRIEHRYHLQKATRESADITTLLVTSNYSLIPIKVADITHIEGLKDYVKIFIEGQPHPVLTRMTMKSIEEKLPPNHFFRVHRSYIVSLNKIEAVRNQRLSIGKYVIPVSDRQYEHFRRVLTI